MLNISVKASQVTNLTDARYFAAREVEWLGFNLDTGTEKSIHPQQISAIKEWIQGPKIVGEFGLQSPDEIKMAAEYFALDAVQIGLFADTEAVYKTIDTPILKEIIIQNEDFAGVETLMDAQSSFVAVFILDLVKNDILWSDLSESTILLLQRLCSKYKVLFNISLSIEKLSTFIEDLKPYGLVLYGDEEEKVGYKSFDELDNILDFLEIEE